MNRLALAALFAAFALSSADAGNGYGHAGYGAAGYGASSYQGGHGYRPQVPAYQPPAKPHCSTGYCKPYTPPVRPYCPPAPPVYVPPTPPAPPVYVPPARPYCPPAPAPAPYCPPTNYGGHGYGGGY